MRFTEPGKHIRHLVLKTMRVPQSRRYDFMLNEGWNKDYIHNWLQAYSYWKTMRAKQPRLVRIFSYSRSGTHNFFSRFHYMPCCFVARENMFEQADDRLQLRSGIHSLRPLDIMAFSVFGPFGLQDKSATLLTHIFMPSNRFLEYPCRLDPGQMGDDIAIMYVRNFFRMLYSHQKSSEKYNKPRFNITDEVFESWSRSHLEKLSIMVNHIRTRPAQFMMVVHEYFCAHPGEVIDSVCETMGIPPHHRQGWDNPAAFFKRGWECGSIPEVRDGKIWDTRRGCQICGTGDNYNPLPLPSLERTMGDPVAAWLTPARLSAARSVFGAELVEFWLNDSPASYERGSHAELINMYSRAADRANR